MGAADEDDAGEDDADDSRPWLHLYKKRFHFLVAKHLTLEDEKEGGYTVITEGANAIETKEAWDRLIVDTHRDVVTVLFNPAANDYSEAVDRYKAMYPAPVQDPSSAQEDAANEIIERFSNRSRLSLRDSLCGPDWGLIYNHEAREERAPFPHDAMDKAIHDMVVECMGDDCAESFKDKGFTEWAPQKKTGLAGTPYALVTPLQVKDALIKLADKETLLPGEVAKKVRQDIITSAKHMYSEVRSRPRRNGSSKKRKKMGDSDKNDEKANPAVVVETPSSVE